jgi:hypothetical protein
MLYSIEKLIKTWFILKYYEKQNKKPNTKRFYKL